MKYQKDHTKKLPLREQIERLHVCYKEYCSSGQILVKVSNKVHLRYHKDVILNVQIVHENLTLLLNN